MKKKRILFVGSFLSQTKDGSVGGQMFASRTLIESEISKEVDWVLLDTTAESNIQSAFYIRFFKALKRIILFLYHLLTKRIDCLLIFSSNGFSFLEKGSMAIIGKLFRKKVIFAPRSGIIKDDISKSALMRKFIPYIFSKVDLVICQGESWKHYFTKLSPKHEHKFIVIQNWFEFDKYPFVNRTLSDFNDTKVLFLAWVDRNKGIIDLIMAVNMLKQKHPNVKYIIAGNGNAMKESVELVNKLGLNKQIEFRGWVKGQEKLGLLKECQMFVLPTYFEGFPNSLLEALASNMAIITTPVGSIPDIVDHGVNGLLFEQGNQVEFSNCLNYLFLNKEKCMQYAQNGYTKIKANNTIEAAIAKFKELLIN